MSYKIGTTEEEFQPARNQEAAKDLLKNLKREVANSVFKNIYLFSMSS